MTRRGFDTRNVWAGGLLLISLLMLLVEREARGQAQAQPPSTRLLIRGGLLVDGSGEPGRVADLRIVGDQIVEVAPRLRPRPGESIVVAKGLVVAPGFIDIHNHSERGLAEDPTARSQILQGITTLAVGPDGNSPWPVAQYLSWAQEKRLAPNLLAFVGHATVRREVMGDDFRRPATPQEIARMAQLVEQAMREGAVGLSSGLEYDTGNPATTEEVITLARAAARFRGIYMSHVRDEADAVMDAFREALRIGREAALPVQISHIKLGTVGVWGKAGEAAALIEEARRDGLDVTADCYPYDAWASTITVLVPSRRHEDPVAVRRGLDDVGGPGNVLITNCRAHPDYEGKTLEAVGTLRGTDAVEAYIAIVRDGGAGVVCRSMTEADIRTFMTQPWVMVSSDGGIGMRHPRGAGTFPRVLSRFVREGRWMSLETAIHKMTELPAARLSLHDRGSLRKGMKADVVVFDPEKILDRSTMLEPTQDPVGIVHVFVNGRGVVRDGQVTGERPGVVHRHTTPRR
ncbi:MAG: N-acyl-D-amino-acid deacylase family protein [Blastocatellia bacterium]